MKFARILAFVCLSVAATAASAQEFRLRYTQLDFDFLYQDTDAQGIQTDVDINQTVSIETSDGTGIGLRGSIQLPARFFLIGEFVASVIDVDGRLTNPITDETISDDFSLRQARFGLGFALPLNDNFHVIAGATYDDTNFDIGSVAGEGFATSDGGIGGRLGVRAKLGRNLELNGLVRYTDVGEVDLNSRTLDSDVLFGGSLLYYIGEAFAFGANAEFGEINSASLTLRFAFGRTRIGV